MCARSRPLSAGLPTPQRRRICAVSSCTSRRPACGPPSINGAAALRFFFTVTFDRPDLARRLTIVSGRSSISVPCQRRRSRLSAWFGFPREWVFVQKCSLDRKRAYLTEKGLFSRKARRVRLGMRGRRRCRVPRRPRIPPSSSIAPVAQHRGGNAQLACDPAQRPTAAHQQATASRLNSSVR